MAGELEQLSVSRDAARYRVEMVAQLDTTAEQAWQVLSKLDSLAVLNDAIESLSVEESPHPDAVGRVVSQIRLCAMFFCRTLNQTQDMYIQGQQLSAVVVPTLSDFKFGKGDWEISDRGGNALLTFSAELEPDFWIPPLIGPWVIRRKLAQEAQVTMINLEKAAQGE